MGSSRTLNLPGGRSVTVSIPAGVQNGDEVRVPGQGEEMWQGGPVGDLILTVAIPPVNPTSSPSNPNLSPNSPTEYISSPSYAPPTSNPGYAPVNGGSIPPTSYSPPPGSPSQPGFVAPTQANDYYSYQQQQRQEPLFLPPQPQQPQQSQQQEPAYYGSPPPYGNYGAGQNAAQTPAPPGHYYPPAPSPEPDLSPRKKTMSSAIIGLIFLLVLVLLIGSGLIYYVGYYQPNLQHTQATQTANALSSATANAQTSATANAQSTANALASATANAQGTASAQASATATALQNILTQATSGTPALNDSLSAQSASNWDELTPAQSTVNGSCAFTNGAYHSVMPTKGFFQPCYAEGPTFTNFAYQVDMTTIQGDEGGILFRADPVNTRFYLFRINTNGGYDLFLYVDSNGKDAKNLMSGSAANFKTGLNATNTLTVVGQGGNLSFFINGQYLNSVSNGTLTSGKIGVFGESTTNSTDVAFKNAKVWQI